MGFQETRAPCFLRFAGSRGEDFAASSRSRRGLQPCKQQQQQQGEAKVAADGCPGAQDTKTLPVPTALLHGWKSRLGVGFSSAGALNCLPSTSGACSPHQPGQPLLLNEAAKLIYCLDRKKLVNKP